MKSEDGLWDTGKEEKDSSSDNNEDNSTLDLSEISPEKNEEEINLELPDKNKEKDEDWAIPLAEDVDKLDLRTIGIVSTIVILLLTGTLFVLLNETNTEIEVPNEKYDEQINYNVNGFVNFDVSFFENFAAVNHYSTIHSCLVFHFSNKKYFTTPIEKDYLNLVDLNKVENIGIFYLLKKEKSEDFKFPYQDRGSAWNSEELYSIDFSFKDGMPHKYYLPQSIEHVSYKKLLKTLWNKFKRRIKF